MKKTLPFLVLFFFAGCSKEKYFDGPDSYADDFEQYYTAADLFRDDESRWSYAQVTNTSNSITIDSTIAHSGSKCARFFAKSSGSNVSKCSIAKQHMAFYEGETVHMTCWYYLEGTARADWMFLFDIEEQAAIGAGPGTRIALTGDSGDAVVEHKFPNPNIYQAAGQEISFPRSQWVKLEMEIKLSQKKKGYVKVWQNDRLILDRGNWKTLPKDLLYFQQGTKGMYTSIEFGITANTRDNDMVLYLDDVDVKCIQ
ncbi:MAG: hypothetical protein FD123_3428 [Bacteroidetes bacterium]|nr:MAG: hypothetical protein FD123_3428 [Bacteroidota bacterium]